MASASSVFALLLRTEWNPCNRWNLCDGRAEKGQNGGILYALHLYIASTLLRIATKVKPLGNSALRKMSAEGNPLFCLTLVAWTVFSSIFAPKAAPIVMSERDGNLKPKYKQQKPKYKQLKTKV